MKKEKVNELKGKTINKAWIEGIKKSYDDEPYLFLEMKDGSVFQITANYGGYTGESEDEYPRVISVTKTKESELNGR